MHRRHGALLLSCAAAGAASPPASSARYGKATRRRPNIWRKLSARSYNRVNRLFTKARATESVMTSDKSETGKQLTPEQYRVLREAGTEPPGSGALLHNKAAGTYRCAGCGAPLFGSDTKYDSGSGWPAFTAPVEGEAVDEVRDTSHGMTRVEV